MTLRILVAMSGGVDSSVAAPGGHRTRAGADLERVEAVAPGQAVVLYDGEVVVGGGPARGMT